jgi:glycosyltransferase involved in cell wall biosynthesis
MAADRAYRLSPKAVRSLLMISEHPPTRVPLSVVVPVFNEREVLPELCRRIEAVADELGVAYELIVVNDGSTDGSWHVILDLACADRRIKAIRLSRNFGHQLAITAGLHVARGEAVVIMDADLQDPPEVIAALYEKFRDGYDVVFAQRRVREGETLWKRATAKAFYRLMRQMTTLDIPVDTGDFRLMSHRVVDDLCRMQEQSPFLRGLVTWVGYHQTAVLYDRGRRYGGVTKFSTAKMLTFAIDGITSFSSRPLRLASHAGVFFAVLSLALMVGLAVYRLLGGTAVIEGWTSLIVAVLFLGGLNLTAIGLLGEYIGRIHDQVKGRPLYLVQDRVNLAQSSGESAEYGTHAAQSVASR